MQTLLGLDHWREQYDVELIYATSMPASEGIGYCVGNIKYSTKQIKVCVYRDAWKIFRTLRHEIRHAWQRINWDGSLILTDRDINEYEDRLVEVDARNFSDSYVEWFKSEKEVK